MVGFLVTPRITPMVSFLVRLRNGDATFAAVDWDECYVESLILEVHCRPYLGHQKSHLKLI